MSGSCGSIGPSEPKTRCAPCRAGGGKRRRPARARTPVLVHNQHVGRRVDRLYRREYVQLRQSGQILGVDALDVFDAVAQAGPRCVARLAVPRCRRTSARMFSTSRLARSPMAWIVRLSPRPGGQQRGLQHFLGIHRGHAPLVRLTFIWLQHAGGAAAQRAVREHLDSAHPQISVAQPAAQADGSRVLQVADRDVLQDAQAQLTAAS